MDWPGILGSATVGLIAYEGGWFLARHHYKKLSAKLEMEAAVRIRMASERIRKAERTLTNLSLLLPKFYDKLNKQIVDERGIVRTVWDDELIVTLVEKPLADEKQKKIDDLLTWVLDNGFEKKP